ncbi:MAG TPA: hypothetical protein VG457_18270 [Planctomycetota bacterium]|jgi:hypothetical protein|nr:hypothetical protein [Planctomycetota bacterium]
MIEIPYWIQVFVLIGIALVVVVVPIRILYEMTKDSRDRSRRFQDLADRLKEKFGAVEAHRTIFGMSRIEFQHDGRPAAVYQPGDDEILIELEPKIQPKFHLIARSRGAVAPPIAVMWESFRILPRILTHEPLIDDAIALYATPIFGSYLREAALDGIPAEGKPTGLAESLVILRKMPGVRRFELRMSPAGGFRVSFRLRADDLLYRPEELESAVHHVFQLYDLLVLS